MLSFYLLHLHSILPSQHERPQVSGNAKETWPARLFRVLGSYYHSSVSVPLLKSPDLAGKVQTLGSSWMLVFSSHSPSPCLLSGPSFEQSRIESLVSVKVIIHPASRGHSLNELTALHLMTELSLPLHRPITR